GARAAGARALVERLQGAVRVAAAPLRRVRLHRRRDGPCVRGRQPARAGGLRCAAPADAQDAGGVPDAHASQCAEAPRGGGDDPVTKRVPRARGQAAEGARIIDRLGFPTDAVPAIRHHHERFDGTGYPDRLAGEEIPLGARIIHVADALDSMLTTRIYRAARPAAEALQELRTSAGTQF